MPSKATEILDAMTPDELKKMLWDAAQLLVECRDALPGLTVTAVRLHHIDPNLDKKIERFIKPWETTQDDPNGI